MCIHSSSCDSIDLLNRKLDRNVKNPTISHVKQDDKLTAVFRLQIEDVESESKESKGEILKLVKHVLRCHSVHGIKALKVLL